MRSNTRIAAFLEKLAELGVTYRLLWEAKRDPKSKFADVFFVSFIGDGFRPGIGTGIIIDYGKDGFGFYPESGRLSVAMEVHAIASTREHPVPLPPKDER